MISSTWLTSNIYIFAYEINIFHFKNIGKKLQDDAFETITNEALKTSSFLNLVSLIFNSQQKTRKEQDLNQIPKFFHMNQTNYFFIFFTLKIFFNCRWIKKEIKSRRELVLRASFAIVSKYYLFELDKKGTWSKWRVGF